MGYELDDVDRQLLTLVQENARYKATELAELVGVSDNTIHNRMERLEENGVISGYNTAIDYDAAGLAFHFHFTCTVPISQRAALADEVMDIPEVVNVTELMTGHENLLIEAVSVSDSRITNIAAQIDELDVEINDENLVRAEHSEPLDFSKIRLQTDD